VVKLHAYLSDVLLPDEEIRHPTDKRLGVPRPVSTRITFISILGINPGLIQVM
jgi:hypothetical protein